MSYDQPRFLCDTMLVSAPAKHGVCWCLLMCCICGGGYMCGMHGVCWSQLLPSIRCIVSGAPRDTMQRGSNLQTNAAWLQPPDICFGARALILRLCVYVCARVCACFVCVFFFCVCAGRSRRVSGHEGRCAGTQHKGSPAPALRRGRLAQGALVFSSTHY